MLIPLYDNEDSVCGICFNGEYFYFQKNLQGDIISVADKDANEVAKYTYDAWGVCTVVSDTSACSIAAINPYRYRGYYYDNETRLYYLQSRYYNAEIGRFVNCDEPVCAIFWLEVLQHNLYTYCGNSATINVDSLGYWWFSISTTMAGIILDAIIVWLLPYLFTAFKATRLLKWAKFSRWFKNKYTSAVKSLAKAIYKGLDSIVYSIMGKAANAATRAFTISKIQGWIESILSLSVGYGIACIIDRFDRDGYSGYIRF